MKRKLFLLIITIVFLVAGAVQAIISNGLVAYFPFNGNANDASGNNNDGIVVGAQLTSDRYGKANSAYAFYGNGSYVDCGNGTSLNLTGSITISLWIYPENLSTGRILSKREGHDGYEFNLFEGELQFVLNGSMKAYYDLTGLENTWVFIAGVYDQTLSPNSVKLYVNQEDPALGVDNFSDPIGVNNGSLYLGIMNLSYPYPFKGKIDSVRIYDRALSAAEIAKLYAVRDMLGTQVPASISPLLLLDQ